MKKFLSILLILMLSFPLFVGCNNGQAGNSSKKPGVSNFPQHDLTGVVQWGAGGGTDSLMRPLSSIAEESLGKSIIIQNKPGATGAIATQYVQDQKADGYTLLMGAENPQLYRMLEISELTYTDFEPIFLIGDEKVGIVVREDSKYSSFEELIEDAKANPEEISMATTGKGGMPWTVNSFIGSITGAKFNRVPYDSDQAALTAVLGGHEDFTVAKIQTGIEAYRAGEIRFLTLMSKEEVNILPEVPLVTEEYPTFEEYLPWGPFYGIFVKKGSPKEVIDTLSEAFQAAYNTEEYQDILEGFNISPLGVTGDKAKEYLSTWQKNTADVLYKSGAIQHSPDELGIE